MIDGPYRTQPLVLKDNEISAGNPFKITIITKITRATKPVQSADVRFTQVKACTMAAGSSTVPAAV